MARVPHPIKDHPAMTYKEPRNVRVGRYMVTGGLILAVLGVLYIAAWFTTSMILRSSLQDWFSARSADGYVAKYDDAKARISGFPFTVKANLYDVRFGPKADAQGQRDWVWAFDRVTFQITPLPWTLSELNVDLSTKQALTVQGVTLDGKAKQFSLTTDWMFEGLPDHMGAIVEGLELKAKGRNERVLIETLRAMAQRESTGDYTFDITGERMNMPFALKGLGNRLNDIILRGSFNQNFAEKGLEPRNLATWRDAGGTLEATRMQLSYGPVKVQGNGTLALDGNLQPVGAFSARIQGFFETVDSLRNAGVVRGPDASMAKVVLGMLAKTPSNGGPATISLPISIQDQALFAGPVKLIKFDPIVW